MAIFRWPVLDTPNKARNHLVGARWPPGTQVDWRAIFGRLCVDKQRSFIRVPEELLNVWHEGPGRQDKGAEEDRGQWEYLYICRRILQAWQETSCTKNAIITTAAMSRLLTGRRDYRAIDDRMIQDVLSVQDDWCQWHECDDSSSLMAENDAVNRVLLHWNNFRNLLGGSLLS